MVEIDVRKACDIVDSKAGDKNHDRIYFSSNESLKDLFHYFSVKGKNVLSVMASGDQPLFSLYHGASNVDTFDVNKLTQYYYYLRYWSILYNNQFYPDKSIFTDHQYIYDLLQKVKIENREEARAHKFWRLFIQNAFPFDCENLYYVGFRESELENMDLLRDRIKGKEIHFTHFDLFEEVPKGRKYDIIITSNILEYAGYVPYRLMKARNNLKSLLTDDGMIVSSHYFHEKNDSFFAMEKDAFFRYFDYHELPPYYDEKADKYYPLGYTYTLKDVNKK